LSGKLANASLREKDRMRGDFYLGMRRAKLRLASRAASICVAALFAAQCFAGEEAFVTCQNGNSVAIVDLDRMAVTATLAIPGNPVGVAVTPDGARVYVTSSEGKTLSVIDAAGRKVIKTIPLKGGPFGVAVHPSGSPVYVTDWFEHRIFVVSPEKGAIEAEVSVGNSPSVSRSRRMARPSSRRPGQRPAQLHRRKKP